MHLFSGLYVGHLEIWLRVVVLKILSAGTQPPMQRRLKHPVKCASKRAWLLDIKAIRLNSPAENLWWRLVKRTPINKRRLLLVSEVTYPLFGSTCDSTSVLHELLQSARILLRFTSFYSFCIWHRAYLYFILPFMYMSNVPSKLRACANAHC